ncbi:MAG: FAD-containing oxidoreductase, partial [Deltaproteobacteria bacterium]
LRRDGVEIVLGARVGRVSRQGESKVLHLEGGEEPSTITVDEILVGAGRAPNIETLDLEAAGVAYEKFGVQVNDHLQTSNPNIYAAGDVCLRYKFTHTADASARIVLQNALFFGRKKMSALTIPWCTYTDPEIAHVGLYERDAQERGIEIDTFTRELSEVDRAIAEGDTEGFVKIHVEKGKDRIVGATIVAGHAGEMISEVTLAIVGNLGLGTIGQVIHPYPTEAEAIKQVADLYNRSRLTPRLKKWMTRYFSWRR